MNIFLQHLSDMTGHTVQTAIPYLCDFLTKSLWLYYYFLLSTHGSPILCCGSSLTAVLSNPNIVHPDAVLTPPMKACEQKFPIIQ